jgi:radical SAM superfamily enzyme YgiQ (UPF0313 family)
MLKLMNKGYLAQEAISALNTCQDAGITASFKFLFGFPGETKETLLENMAGLKKLKRGVVCSGVNIFEPHPGSLVYPLLKRYGWVDDDIWFTNFKMDDFVKLRYPKMLVESIYSIKEQVESSDIYKDFWFKY